MLPSREEAMKIWQLGQQKMTYVLPHWRTRQMVFTSSSKLMREGETFVKGAEWLKAIKSGKSIIIIINRNKAKVASNIALAYEMLGDMEEA